MMMDSDGGHCSLPPYFYGRKGNIFFPPEIANERNFLGV